MEPQAKPSFLQRNALFFKAAVIFILVLILMIPTSMIESLIHERENRKNEAVNEVSQKWGNEQTLLGPVLTIPYYKYYKEKDNNYNTEKLVKKKEYYHILPTDLKIKGDVAPETRHRGIFDIVLYVTDVQATGTFKGIDLSRLDIPEKDILLNQAFLNFGLSDLRGIEEQIELSWNKEKVFFNPGTLTDDISSSGVHAFVPLDSLLEEKEYSFNFDVQFKGSEKLKFAPVGKVTEVELASTWNNPSFDGAFLPDSHTVSEKGFNATWKILHLNRDYPQAWQNSDYRIKSSAFGVNLRLPIDHYQKTFRSAKYAILFIALTYLIFFFIEVLNKKYVHPIQYILVGLALCLFYTLLLSFAEHSSYTVAYVIAMTMTVGLITAYASFIFKSKPLTYMLGGILTILYGFIYIIIQQQDYALLMGSIGLFLILALVMYFSRQIDWYKINEEMGSRKND